jgi:hypothetical protein
MGVLTLHATQAAARISIEPYASIKSTKSVNPAKRGDTLENEEITQRQEYGIRASVGFWRLFKFQVSVGQSKLTETKRADQVKDEYDEIDFQQELNVSTDDPAKDVSITETQNNARASLVFDPSFSVFIARLKLGITARQRIIEKEEAGLPAEKITHGPTYKPHSGFGLGIRINSRMYFMAEYEVYHYKYPPDLEPFERQLTVSYSVAI